MNRSFSPAWWLRGPHLQTLWGKFLRRQRIHDTRVERLETPDGDFVNLHHLDAPAESPVLILFHGLEGSVRSHYVQGLLGEARRRRWRAAVLVFRSCGGELNRGRRFYHSGETGDARFVIAHMESAFPSAPLVLAGVSLGGNVLLKYLGEEGSRISPRIRGAAAVSVPYDLARSSRFIDQGFSRVYQQSFIRSLKSKALRKLDHFPDLASRDAVNAADTMFAFDDCFTAPVHGFRDATDYYSKSSSMGWIHSISINTLLMSATDDPFLPPAVLEEVAKLASGNPHLQVEFSSHGGHVGFVGGLNPFAPVYYLEKRVCGFLASQIDDSGV